MERKFNVIVLDKETAFRYPVVGVFVCDSHELAAQRAVKEYEFWNDGEEHERYEVHVQSVYGHWGYVRKVNDEVWYVDLSH